MEEINNNVEVFYCADFKEYFILDKIFNKNSIYSDFMRDRHIYRTQSNCTYDNTIKKNLTELEAQNLCIILNKLMPNRSKK